MNLEVDKLIIRGGNPNGGRQPPIAVPEAYSNILGDQAKEVHSGAVPIARLEQPVSILHSQSIQSYAYGHWSTRICNLPVRISEDRFISKPGNFP